MLADICVMHKKQAYILFLKFVTKTYSNIIYNFNAPTYTTSIEKALYKVNILAIILFVNCHEPNLCV